MRAPEGFHLNPVADNLNKPPTPPNQLKSTICKDPAVFARVDEHAIAEAKKNYASFRDLLWNLVFKETLSELEKTRAIFRWMTCVNFSAITFSDTVTVGSPEQLLLAFNAGKTTYARIFECMARNAGLACVTITGWAKGVDYRPGVAITQKPVNHSWNAVYIEGNWQLIDSHWATRYLQSETQLTDNLVYEYDDFYFIPHPAQLAYTHRPDDNLWQLLETAQTAEQFEDYPLVKSYFFANDMFFAPDENHGVLTTKKGITALSVRFTIQTAFTFKLVYGDNMMESLNNVELNKYVLQETVGNAVEFHVRLPCRGDYYLIVFAHLVVDNVPSLENVFKAVCEYKIIGGADIPPRVEPFPNCSDVSWGPDSFVGQYRLEPLSTDAILKAADGRALVKFTKKKKVPTATLR